MSLHVNKKGFYSGIYLHVGHVVSVFKSHHVFSFQNLVYLLLTALWETGRGNSFF